MSLEGLFIGFILRQEEEELFGLIFRSADLSVSGRKDQGCTLLQVALMVRCVHLS